VLHIVHWNVEQGGKMLIRDLQYDDVPHVTRIIEENWNIDVAWQAGFEMDEMFNPHTKWPPHYYVAVLDGKIVGCAGYKAAWLMSNTYELIWINIDKNYQGRGIGSMLTHHRLGRIETIGGNLVLLMSKKRKFFEIFGFESVKEFDGWHLMSKKLGTVDVSGVTQ
jgi:N-acetylglutamate synthase-like GNAT family acetyltransferase